MFHIGTDPKINLSLHQPPGITDVGYFCCVCVSEHPKVAGNCFGVAYMPHVAHFTITQRKGKAVSGVHIGDQIRIECEVHGFPLHFYMSGPSEMTESPQCTKVSETWYTKMQYIDVSHAITSFSGVYTCAVLLHASSDMNLMTEIVKRNVVVYASPTITGTRRLNQNERKFFNYPIDTDVILCGVKSSIVFNITWLFNGNVVSYPTSKCIVTSDTDEFTCILEVPHTAQNEEGEYECVVITAYATRETSQIVTQHHMLLFTAEILIRIVTNLEYLTTCVITTLLKTLVQTTVVRTWKQVLVSGLIGPLISTFSGVLMRTLCRLET